MDLEGRCASCAKNKGPLDSTESVGRVRCNRFPGCWAVWADGWCPDFEEKEDPYYQAMAEILFKVLEFASARLSTQRAVMDCLKRHFPAKED